MATPFGNYQHYYSKRQVSLINGDPRVALLPPFWIQGKRVLDIGTNSGAVAVEIAQKLDPSQVVGIDIDPELIKKAQTHLAFVWSLQSPTIPSSFKPTPQPSSTGEGGKPLVELNHFPISLPKTHGFVPLPSPPSPSTSLSTPSFPLNTSFHTANFVFDTPLNTPETYHLILAFSLTKWVHLHHLDAGLRSFFQRIYDHLEPGGRFVLEKQSWAGYRDGAKKSGDKSLRTNLPLLMLRPEDFNRVLVEEIGFVEEPALRAGRVHVGGEKEGFERPMEVFRKPLLRAAEEDMDVDLPAGKSGKKKEKRRREGEMI